MSENTEVVVLGGGYGGVKAANRLARRAGVSVTLVNPRPDFVERIRLHQLVTGSDDAVESFGKVLGRNVRLVVDTATLIAPAERRVSLAGGSTSPTTTWSTRWAAAPVPPACPGPRSSRTRWRTSTPRDGCGRRWPRRPRPLR